MIISIDYDETWTLDPPFWQRFCRQAVRSGHMVILVTNRPGTAFDCKELRKNVSGWVSEIVFAGTSPKRAAAAARGFRPDVWIDDLPLTVENGRVC